MNSLIKTLYLCDYHYPYFDHLNLKKKLMKKHAILQNISKLFYTMTLKDLVNSIGKVSDDWITDLEFNPYLH